MTALDDLLAAIAKLEPKQRERLLRRAQQMDLLPEESFAGLEEEDLLSLDAVPRSVIPGAETAGEPTPALIEEEVSALEQEAPVTDPPPGVHMELVFDGGSKGNPGQGYGSYLISWDGEVDPVVRLDFGPDMTNNEAEYDTLTAALEAVLAELEDMGIDPAATELQILGDSLLVINQVTGKWRVKEPRLKPRCAGIQELLERFGESVLVHQPREKSVALLGH
ncbi:MAG: ribonuclease HI family protein [Chloroflexota bacterium]|nr:ribonuclease HI family protein [Chloroflexota bacterium]